MEEVWVYSLFSVLIVSAVSLVGVFALILRQSFFKKIQSLLVSFAVGTLIGGAVLHLLPESLEHDHEHIAPMLVVISIMLFFILEKYLNTRLHYSTNKVEIKSFGPLNLFADGMHNFLDGILIAAAYSIDVQTGIIATIAIVAHELPQEIGDFAILVQAGYTVKRAIFYNLLSALSSIIGCVLFLIFPHISEELSHFILPLAVGGFLYIALANLVPELNKQNSIKRTVFQVVFMVLGLILMWVLLDFHSLQH